MPSREDAIAAILAEFPGASCSTTRRLMAEAIYDARERETALRRELATVDPARQGGRGRA